MCTPLVAAAGSSAAAQALFESRRLTPPGEYTKHIEGPAVDASGNLYVMNFGREDGTIGKVKPGATRSAPFATLPPKSIGNGARFDRDGRMYVADFNNHIVFVIARGQNDPQPYFTSTKFNQPNDLAIAADGTLYASDPKGRTGQVWRIRRRPDGTAQGEVMSSERTLHKTNGIDLSPAGDTLYVGESDTRQIWAYRLEGAKLVAPRLVKRFDDDDVDGLRTDVDGRIYVTRPGHGTVVVLKPDGTVVREIRLQGKDPTNLTFGGTDGRTVYVTQAAGRFIETFRVDRPGREPCLQVPTAC